MKEISAQQAFAHMLDREWDYEQFSEWLEARENACYSAAFHDGFQEGESNQDCDCD
jgi:hypothetical protein